MLLDALTATPYGAFGLIEQEAFGRIADILKPQSFYESKHRLIFEAIQSLSAENKPIDILTVTEQMRVNGTLEEAGGPYYIAELSNKVVSSAHIEYHAKIIAQKYLARELIKYASQIQEGAFTEGQDVDELMQTAEGRLFELSKTNIKKDFVQIDPVLNEAYKWIEEAAHNPDGISGISSGFYQLDEITNGWQKSDLIIIAARPSMGKTAFVLNIAQHICFREGKGAVIFSLEMSRQQLVNRLLSLESHVNSNSIRNGSVSARDWEGIIEGASTIGESKLIIDDTPGISVGELRSKCRKYKAENKDLAVIMIDYLQLMSGNGRTDSRQQEISDISRSLKALARELNVPVVALSQLSRAVEKRDDHRPMLSDLRESGAIEQDADVVMFLYRDDYYNPDTEKKGIAEVIIAKQRNGPIGKTELVWLPDLTKFANKAKN